jgi:site-specific DNA-methyltransferase (adenine-specific)
MLFKGMLMFFNHTFTELYKYQETDNSILYHGDCLEILKLLPSNSVNVIITDPPYFLSNNGVTCHSGKMVSVNKGDWDKVESKKEMDKFNRMWLSECKRVLSKDGTMWVFGTLHNIYSIGNIIQELEFKLLNNITWVKSSPPPNLSCRVFTHSTETILWFKENDKSKYYFNYNLMKEINENKQMKDVWSFGRCTKFEKRYGKHPTQKPSLLIQNLIEKHSNVDDVVLDCFAGSGTTGEACIITNRKFILIEMNEDYHSIISNRLIN